MRNNLRKVRLRSGYSDVNKLASKIGISASYYYKIEQGIRTPGIDLAKKIADILNETVDDLFFNPDLDTSSNEYKKQEVS